METAMGIAELNSCRQLHAVEDISHLDDVNYSAASATDLRRIQI
jgi:hypothetical protein